MELFISFPIIEKSQNLTENFNISNVEIFNNISYNYEQLGNYNEAIFLLEKIVKKDPNRLVAWLNLADAQWGCEEKKEAKESYQKYISLMKSQNKDLKKIPQRVHERIK